MEILQGKGAMKDKWTFTSSELQKDESIKGKLIRKVLVIQDPHQSPSQRKNQQLHISHTEGFNARRSLYQLHDSFFSSHKILSP